jgi:lipoprotein-anchoring transpeptidase ErfK/SrfK
VLLPSPARAPTRLLLAPALALLLAAPPAGAGGATVTGAADADVAPPRASSADAARALPPPSRRTVTLARTHVAYPTPSTRSGRGVRIPATRPITRARTVLPVLGTATSPDGHRWLRVLLPGRPNGATGWISARASSAGISPWAIEVDLSRRRLTVRRDERVVRRFGVIVGAARTPTPRGRFFVEETVRLPGNRTAGPFALALSARSNVLQEFDGGPGQIALHGRDGGIGGTIGTAVSHGCIRLSDRSITWLATRIGPGVRVTIHG